jgi:hypothetical protein
MGRNWRKLLLVTAGTAAVGLGVAGIFLPVLPTTPFLLLAAGCYLRSSPALYQRLVTHRIIGPYLTNYLTYRAVRRRTKIVALIFLWATLAVSICLIGSLAIRLLLAGVGLAVSIHILTLRSMEAIERQRSESQIDREEQPPTQDQPDPDK